MARSIESKRKDNFGEMKFGVTKMTSLKQIIKSKIGKRKRQTRIAQLERELGLRPDGISMTQKRIVLKPGRWYKQKIESNGRKIEEFERIRIMNINTPFCYKLL